jgi:hypothetical protein
MLMIVSKNYVVNFIKKALFVGMNILYLVSNPYECLVLLFYVASINLSQPASLPELVFPPSLPELVFPSVYLVKKKIESASVYIVTCLVKKKQGTD